jgi:hypothetical protein
LEIDREGIEIMNQLIESSAPVLRADTERTYKCDNPHCIYDEHTTEDGPDYVIHVAGRASHGAVDIEVYRAPEDGAWKLDIHADFILAGVPLTKAQARALAADIAAYADLVDELNRQRFSEKLASNLERILAEHDDPKAVEEFGDLNNAARFTEALLYIHQNHGVSGAELVAGTEQLL